MLVAFGLGANLGAAESTLHDTVRALARAFAPLQVASLYRSRPLGGLDQPDYLNTAVVGWTERSAAEVLAFTQSLERDAGRQPGPRHASRPLDIDLLLYGDEVAASPGLTLPHPGLGERWFVLAPLAELVPGLVVPPGGETVRGLLARVAKDPYDREVGWSTPPLPGAAAPPAAVSSPGDRELR